ncbi:N-acetyl-1-D-myo-inositol-2-amino-2-deoxy-alpha-D-glucopyranoside deacetylase [soil metagenome]
MSEPLRLLAVFAHPDDESLGLGGTLAHYAGQGVETYLLTATRGERGRYFDNADRPTDEEVGRVREGELRAAARELGIGEVTLLGYLDGELDQADPADVITNIAGHMRRIRADVVVTFGHDGAYGHPDHIAISQLTCAAFVAAADPGFGDDTPSHRASKLYFMGWPPRIWELYQAAFKKLVSVVDGVERQVSPWPEWSLTTRIDARSHWQTVWRAIRCHQTQMAVYERLDYLTPEQHEVLWGDQHFYRVLSTVNGGRRIETDLFDGVRHGEAGQRA